MMLLSKLEHKSNISNTHNFCATLGTQPSGTQTIISNSGSRGHAPNPCYAVQTLSSGTTCACE